jgi:eukaryotic-like serine/threonine-protein kinase
MVVTGSGLIIDDRYRLDEQVAAGGVGQVWQATDLLLERPVAVKVLRPEYADHPDTVERFRKEARHAGALSHPRVAQVYDFGHAGSKGSPYLVMEYVDGPSLADLLLDSPLDPVFALDVIAQAADGLSAAHLAGLVHRDVKPGNILIGQEGRVKLTDFGIAHAVGQAPVTDPALVMGTSQYLAPERIAGGPGTPASDLYSLGIVLHECLTGMPPYDGTPAEVMASHLYLPLPPLPAAVPPELDALVAQLTAKDPARRIRDARELAALASRLRDAIAAGTARMPGPPAPGPAAPSLPGPAAPSLSWPVGRNRDNPAVWDLDMQPAGTGGEPPLTAATVASPHDYIGGAGHADGTGHTGHTGGTGHTALAGEPTAPPRPPDLTGGLLLEGAGARLDAPRDSSLDATARRRQRRAAAILGAIAIVLASGGLAGLLVSGALGTPAAKSPPASTASSSQPQRTGPAAPGSTSASGSGGAVSAPPATSSGTPSHHARHGKSGKTATPSPSRSASPSGSPVPSPSPSSPGTPTSPSDSPSGTPSTSGTPSASPSASPSKSDCILGICF